MATACHLQTIFARFKLQGQAGIFRLLEANCGHMYQAAHANGTCICLFLLKPIQIVGPCRANQTEDQRVAALAANAARQRERRWRAHSALAYLHFYLILVFACMPVTQQQMPDKI